MENMIFDLDVTFSSKCLGEARDNNISISEMLRAIAIGEVERLDQGRLTFTYKGIEVQTSSSGIVALNVRRLDANMNPWLEIVRGTYFTNELQLN
ncbi:hypothetical protein M899_0437 [Bacteriovorax sp. BSW11_IV]|uniref:hypothetical protein n=1 Tax=Bacteriovorax sp. BSW11_IV TaxID=1353529 RepID=UPI00038A1E25|nr:hypothetical protein [Bacteriovorax sp. BSW11_IV]EQC45052.1 hypothetical protein M899_0437 [Bacteriovorax sp. BSW11_IV]